jgi:uncharacterized repeat protein (TIGR02543 family)
LAEEAEKIDVAEVEIVGEGISVTFASDVEPLDVYNAADTLFGVFKDELDAASMTITLANEKTETFDLDQEGVVGQVAFFLLDGMSPDDFLAQGGAIEATYTAAATDNEGVGFTLAGTLTFAVQVDTSAYDAIVAQVATLDEDAYTKSSWAAYEVAIEDCNLELTAADGQAALDAEVVKIEAALDLLEEVIEIYESVILEQDYDTVIVAGNSIEVNLGGHTAQVLTITGDNVTLKNGTVIDLTIAEGVENVILEDISDGEGGTWTFAGGGSGSIIFKGTTSPKGTVIITSPTPIEIHAQSTHSEISGNVIVKTVTRVVIDTPVQGEVEVQAASESITIKKPVNKIIAFFKTLVRIDQRIAESERPTLEKAKDVEASAVIIDDDEYVVDEIDFEENPALPPTESVIISIENIIVEARPGDAFSLPTMIEVVLSDGTRVDKSVDWSPSTADTSEEGTFTFVGTVPGYAGIAKLLLRVKEQVTIYTLTYTAGQNGSIEGGTNQQIEHGQNGSQVTAEPDPGYHFVKWSDGSTINPRTDTNVTADITVEAIFVINKYTVTFVDWNGDLLKKETIVHGNAATAPADPEREGYSFIGWFKDEALQNEWNFDTDTVTAATTLYAKWEPNTNTAYKVEHYQKDVGATTYTLVDIDNLTGTTGAQTAAEAKDYEGFIVKEFSQATIAADGSTVVKIYYDRNEYTMTYKITGDFFAEEKYTTETYEFGAAIAAVTTPSEVGYTFVGWTGVPETMPAENITVTGYYTANEDTAYKVEHYQQNIYDDEYILVEADTENLTGTTGAEVTATDKGYTGFTLNEDASKMSGTIAADGSLVLKLYYDRDTFTVSFESNDGSLVSDIIGVRYEATIDKPVDPEKEGYTFGGWFKEESLVNEWIFASDKVTEAITLYAKWEANTDIVYTVQHYQQDVTGDGYTLKDTEDLIGTTDANVIATAKEYTGFTVNEEHPNWIASGNIAADGSLVLKLFYDRDTFTVNFESNGGSDVGAITGVRYGATIIEPEAPTKIGYTLAGWFTETGLINEWVFESDMVMATTILYAKWDANTDTAYTVEHYQQNIDDDDYTKFETTEHAGTTDTMAVAQAKIYTGFTENTTYEGRVASGNIAADGSLVLKLYYDREIYNIDFIDHDDSVIKSETVRYMGSATAPTQPEREGYTFTGWDRDFENITGNLSVKAVYSINQYTITFDSAGGSAVAEITDDYGATITAPSAPTRDGYTFTGWDKDIPESMPAEDMTITAQWTANEYSITYDWMVARTMRTTRQPTPLKQKP